MNELIDSLELESRVEIETPPPFYDPYFLHDGTAILRLFREVYQQRIGYTPHFAGHRGVVDANVFVADGNIPTVVFGPKGANHHRAGEYVESATIEPVAEVYAETARRFLSASEPTAIA